MAHMVFGKPITEETLKGMPEYQNKTTITRTEKAQVALNMKREVEAQAFEYMEENLKKEKSGGYDGVITFVHIYNATGGTITYSRNHDYSGNLVERPVDIENGHCHMFKHKETSGKKSGSCGAVVYQGKNNHEEDRDWMFSWSNPNPTTKDNKVFTKIAEHGYPFNWDHVHERLMDSGISSEHKWSGCASSMTSTPRNNTRGFVGATASLTTAEGSGEA